MLPVLLTILLLTLEHTSEGIEYHVKPTDPEVTQCPGQPCQTLAEYLENKTWDYSSHAKVVIMPGHHRVTQSFLVIFAFNFTLLGGISDNHTLHDTRPILHVASIGLKLPSIWTWLESLSSNLMNWKSSLGHPSSLPTCWPCESVRLLYTVHAVG